MTGLYLFSLGLGGVLLLASLFADADAPDDIGDAGWQHLFSLRNLTYFLFVFGAVGAGLTLLHGNNPAQKLIDAIIAGGTGLSVAAMVHLVFEYIRRTDSAEVESDTALVGQTALVTLPVGSSGIGKVELTHGGQRVELLARPFDGEKLEGLEIANGSEVVIVDMVGGTALVSRISGV